MSKAKKRWIILLSIFIGVILAASLTFYFVFDVKNWQKLDASKLTVLAQTSTLYDGQENIITTLKGSENRTLVAIDDIPLHTQQAFIAAEDVRFYEHSGIDVYRIFGALRSNLQSGSLAEGASTITQQLAKLTHLSSEKTLRRKLEEIYLAFQIERTYSKNEILTMYLNTVYFGRGAYGIQAAAQAYFGIDAKDLTVAQSACLAAIIKAPSVYAPHISPESNKNRRNYILNVMYENSFISFSAMKDAQSESLWVIAQRDEPQAYSWYVDEILRESAQIMNCSADEIISGGFQIYTSFDPQLQAIADRVYEDKSLFPANASDGTLLQSAMAVVDTRSGAVLAMIGGRSYTTRRGLNRATQMRRQPGSALKPLAVYGPALELGYTTASVLLDEKTSFGSYTPRNAGDRYYGLVTMRTAVRNSLNTTAVRLLEEIGMDASVRYLQKLGIPVQDSDRNLSLALGSMSYGVTPVELAAAYVPYANGGTFYSPHCVNRICSADGTILYERDEQGEPRL